MSPGLDGDLAVLVEELADRDDAFGLVADVDDDFRRGHLENRALDDLAFRDVPEAVIVGIEQPGVFVGVDLVVVFARTGLQPAAIAARCAVERSRRCSRLGRTGSVLVFYVRHALRVLLCRSIADPITAGDCRSGFSGSGGPQFAQVERSLNSDKQQRVRHLSPNCQGSERTPAWPNARPRRRRQTGSKSSPETELGAADREAPRPPNARPSEKGRRTPQESAGPERR